MPLDPFAVEGSGWGGIAAHFDLSNLAWVSPAAQVAT